MKPLNESNNGRCVIVTQPTPACDTLCDLLRGEGIVPLHLPSYRIDYIDGVSEQKERIQDADWVIITSQHVFQQGAANLPDRHYIAIGPRTAKVGKSFGLNHITVPDHPSSEGILELPETQAMDDQDVLILSGENPRSKLASTLEERGASVDYLFCYRREPTHYTQETVKHLTTENIIAITIHGLDNLRCLADTLSQAPESPLWKKPLLMPTARYKKVARELGFCGDFLVSASTSPTDLMKTLLT